MTAPPIILVPGFWLGAWAWDDVGEGLRGDGHNVTALTLPGLESAAADRAAVTLADHVDAICAPSRRPDRSCSPSTAGRAAPAMPRAIASPSGSRRWCTWTPRPATGALDPEFTGDEKPLVPGELGAEENLDGLSEEQHETFRLRAVPEPGGVLRDASDAHQRRAPRHPKHLDLHRVLLGD